MRNDCWPSSLFPPWSSWEKGHDRLERRRIARAATTPEDLGLTGCWQVLVVEREVIELHPKPTKESKATAAAAPAAPTDEATVPAGLERHFYATSYTLDEHTGESVLAMVRGHWSAIENGTHYRRDVTQGEDRCRVRHGRAAPALASLRNLAIGVYELARAAGRTTAPGLAAWSRQQTFRAAAAALRR